MSTTHRTRAALWLAGILTATILASCSSESASERLEGMSNEEWDGLSEDEQLELMQDAAKEVGSEADAPAEDPVAEGGGGDSATLAVGEVYTYADGLQISLSEPYDLPNPGAVPSRYLAIDLVATNPTDQAISTTQAWVSLRAGDAGDKPDWYDGNLDAVLQPGAETSEPYTYDLPMDTEHITATVQWLESDSREDVVFTVVP